jgi:hypothetical protein
MNIRFLTLAQKKKSTSLSVGMTNRRISVAVSRMNSIAAFA